MKNNNKYLKNPFNYIGGKYKLLDKLYPLFPKEIDTFYDIFGGSGEVSINLDNYDIKYNKIVICDKNKQLISILNHLKNNGKYFIKDVENFIKKYKLSKTNKKGYLELREYYNSNYKNMYYNYVASVILYTLLTHSFNNFLTFNNKDEFNAPFGMNRSTFNNSLKTKLQQYIDKLSLINIEFKVKDFKDIQFNIINKNDFVYLDPPYYITAGAYERNSKTKWNKEYEKLLYSKLFELDKNSVKFVLSNVTEHKGKINEILQEVININKFNLKLINNFNYNHCNYQSKNEDKKTQEIILYN